MKYFITGAKGQLGYDIIRELVKRHELDYIAFDSKQLDITNETMVMDVITSYKPDVIFHCAAYTNVENAEDESETCSIVNQIGTKNIIEGAKKVGSKVVYISTDYVFDGKKEGYYDINDSPNPLSVYGKTKYLGELETLKYENTFVIRTSWLFGINGNNFAKRMYELTDIDSINIVEDQIGSPTYTADLAEALIDISNTDKHGIYHVTNKGTVNRYEFTKAILKLGNSTVKVNPITYLENKTKAVRPLNSKLSNKVYIDNGFKELRTWEEALECYIEELRNSKNEVDL